MGLVCACLLPLKDNKHARTKPTPDKANYYTNGAMRLLDAWLHAAFKIKTVKSAGLKALYIYVECSMGNALRNEIGHAFTPPPPPAPSAIEVENFKT